MADYGLAALSGLLNGLGGLPSGMVQREKFDQTQQQLDESARHAKAIEDLQTTDLGQLSQMLGIPLAGVAPGMRVPNTTANVVVNKALADQQKKEQQAQLEALRGQVPEQARAFLGVPGGAELYKAIHGADAQKLISSDKPIYNPQTGQWIQPPASATPTFTPPAGYRPVPTVNAKGEASTRYEPPPWQQELAEKALRDAGWTPDMPGYSAALYTSMTPLTPVAEGGFAVPRTMSVPPPPARAAAVLPNTPAAQQPIVQEAGKNLANALNRMNQAAGELPGVPAQASPGPQRMPGGGIQGPPKTQALPAEQVQKLGDIRTFLSALDQAEQLYKPEYVGPVLGRRGALRQMLDLPVAGLQASPEETQFRTVLQSFANQLLYLRSGAAVTPQEYERITRELPTANDPPTVFVAKLKTARSLLQQAIKNREAEFAQKGFRGAESAPAPAQANPPTPPAAQQYIEGKLYKGSDGKMYRFQGGQMVPQ